MYVVPSRTDTIAQPGLKGHFALCWPILSSAQQTLNTRPGWLQKSRQFFLLGDDLNDLDAQAFAADVQAALSKIKGKEYLPIVPSLNILIFTQLLCHKIKIQV